MRFQKSLDCEMKNCTRERVGMAERKCEKEAINQEEEEQFWTARQLGERTSKSLLNTVRYYIGKLFDFRKESMIIQRLTILK